MPGDYRANERSPRDFAQFFSRIDDLGRFPYRISRRLKKRILIAEDDELVGELLELRLNQIGYAVELVRSGPAAIERALADRPDLLLSDLWMPGCNGLEVIKRLRSAGATFAIIAMTASRFGHERTQALGAGANQVLEKPFQFTLLKTRLEALIA